MAINILQKYRRINSLLLLAFFVQVFLGQSLHIILEHHDTHQCHLEGGESHYHSDNADHRHCAICSFKLDSLKEFADSEAQDQSSLEKRSDLKRIRRLASKTLEWDKSPRGPPVKYN